MANVIRRFISYVGKVKLGDFKDPSLLKQVHKYCNDQETRDPRIKQASIQGTELHQSHKDPNDPKKVISIKFLDEEGKRVGTGHLHEDGTSTFRHKQKPPPSDPSPGDSK
ncbi:hypothetical protein M409DRAFT_27898 [Zasmidium cellare ATCC 36951]|uniref:Uncharacterized protein n=1 Tax=Zasmidium cellare ATCC 36951 TaxID=1080233 RepID=A0A6A6C7G2_ZASCE|nr:uncharacterized protein M409DRAFT_27898 [Zasmidium cellare ATCC 36951]KAF2161842.1 hypothetical protein M409DRAFT_27898 [Zasmidium cellare ATCC 36951]